MPGMEGIGKLIVVFGVGVVIVGGLLWLAGRFLGNNPLPGTIRIDTGVFTCIFPLLGSIVLSIVLTVVLNLLLRMLNK